MTTSLLSSHVATAVGASLVLWSLSTEGREASVALTIGMACLGFALGVLWACRPWRLARAQRPTDIAV